MAVSGTVGAGIEEVFEALDGYLEKQSNWAMAGRDASIVPVSNNLPAAWAR